MATEPGPAALGDCWGWVLRGAPSLSEPWMCPGPMGRCSMGEPQRGHGGGQSRELQPGHKGTGLESNRFFLLHPCLSSAFSSPCLPHLGVIFSSFWLSYHRHHLLLSSFSLSSLSLFFSFFLLILFSVFSFSLLSSLFSVFSSCFFFLLFSLLLSSLSLLRLLFLFSSLLLLLSSPLLLGHLPVFPLSPLPLLTRGDSETCPLSQPAFPLQPIRPQHCPWLG